MGLGREAAGCGGGGGGGGDCKEGKEGVDDPVDRVSLSVTSAGASD